MNRRLYPRQPSPKPVPPAPSGVEGSQVEGPSTTFLLHLSLPPNYQHLGVGALAPTSSAWKTRASAPEELGPAPIPTFAFRFSRATDHKSQHTAFLFSRPLATKFFNYVSYANPRGTTPQLSKEPTNEHP